MRTPTESARNDAVTQILHEEWGRVCAVLLGHLGDWNLVEDALQDACVAALETWPKRGIPDQPRAWLFVTAKRRAIDHLRKQQRQQNKLAELELWILQQQPQSDLLDNAIPDKRLSLIFTCCHPSISEDAQVALTLRTLCGLSTMQIAKAFLVTETTMQQRLVRAKNKIHKAGIAFRVPGERHWRGRLDAVLGVIYLVFSEGHTASSGDTLSRPALCEEALYLGCVLNDLVPGDAEILGLLALMYLHDSRLMSRRDDDGEMLDLAEQDRAAWDQNKISYGTHLLDQAIALSSPGPYQIQAAISALHAKAITFAHTDWRQITLLYAKLHALSDSPVVKLNWAVALSFADSPRAGLAHLTDLLSDTRLSNYQPLHAAHGDLLRRCGESGAARLAYEKALSLTDNQVERRYLERRAATLKVALN